MIALDAERAGAALGLAPLAGPVPGVSIDTRSLRPGDLFVALRGERFDGHDFVEAAFAAGACGAVVEAEVWDRRSAGGDADTGSGRATGPIYSVPDTLEALGALAREERRISGVTVFAVTGSVGKTSTKDLLQAMVGRVRRVVATAGNQNNEVGVPLTLLSIEPETEAVVVEMGMRGRGQIAGLARVAEPDVGVITNVHPVHLELLGTMQGIAEAKAELVAGVRPGGAAVVPADCALLRPFCAGAASRVVRFGVEDGGREAEVRGWLEWPVGAEVAVFVLRWPEGEARIETAPMAAHQVENAVAAAAACYAAGLPVGECAAGIADVRFSAGRGDIIDVQGLCIVNDTYNANPAAVRAALDDLMRLAARRTGRPVAVLGDMLELGPEEARYHEEVGAYAATVGVRALWGVGRLARATVEGYRREMEAQKRPSADWCAGHVDSCEESSSVSSGLRRGDVVLFKASRSLRLETMVNMIVEEAGRRGGA
jgi:UDP-N-acetylmuramoyl-tripeptide--D-alanyl-D-alanine ligase